MAIPAGLVVLTGQGDTYIFVVDKETIDWINSPDMGQLADDEPSRHFWADQTAPLAIKERLWAEEVKDYNKRPHSYSEPPAPSAAEYELMITSGSWSNDRAMAILGIGGIKIGEEIFSSFDSIREVNAFCKKHALEIVDEFHGDQY